MKRNLWMMTVVFWVLFIVATLLIFWPARAVEEPERTENRTEITLERTECVIEEPEEDFENEYICLQCPGVLYGGVLWRLNAKGVSIAATGALSAHVIISRTRGTAKS